MARSYQFEIRRRYSFQKPPAVFIHIFGGIITPISEAKAARRKGANASQSGAERGDESRVSQRLTTNVLKTRFCFWGPGRALFNDECRPGIGLKRINHVQFMVQA